MRVNYRYILSVFLTFLLVAGSVWADLDVFKASTCQRSAQASVFTIWLDQESPYFVQNQETEVSFQTLAARSLMQIKINRASMVTKAYHTHNQLHFNIPLTCCKYSVKEYTCGG